MHRGAGGVEPGGWLAQQDVDNVPRFLANEYYATGTVMTYGIIFSCLDVVVRGYPGPLVALLLVITATKARWRS